MKGQVKKSKLVSYENLTQELLEIIHKRYPYGIDRHLIKVENKNKQPFYALLLEVGDTRYLIKVNREFRQAMRNYLDDLENDESDIFITNTASGVDDDFGLFAQSEDFDDQDFD